MTLGAFSRKKRIMASFALFFRLFGQILMVAAALMLLPFFDTLLSASMSEAWMFLLPSAAAFLTAMLFIRLARRARRPMRVMEGALFMVLIFPVLGVYGMLPLYFSGMAGLSAAFFEAVATLTTTGLSNIGYRYAADSSLLLWHCLMSWLGGLIFILVLVTVLPQVSGCFGLTLTARQSIHFSPVWNKMRQAGQHGFCAYLALTVLSSAAFLLAGLTPFQAIVWAMTTISSGGAYTTAFMTRDSLPLEAAAVFSMLLAALNLLTLWRAFHARQFFAFLGEKELRLFLLVFLLSSALLTVNLWTTGAYSFFYALRYGVFHAASFLTTTGFASAPMENFPPFSKLLLLLLAFTGGSIASAGGGIKILRLLVLFRLARLEVRRTLHPHMVVSISVDGRPVSTKIVGRIRSFFYFYVMTFLLSAFVITLSGTDLMPSMGLAAAALTSAGAISSLFGSWDFAVVPIWLKFFLTLVMVLGRIEIFSALILVDGFLRVVRRRL